MPGHGAHSVCTGSLRVGEASHPGLEGADLFHIGTSNPSGLRSKEALAVELGPGIFHYSETQLSEITAHSCTRVLQQLASRQNRDLRITVGAPVSLRPGSQWAGSWSGVLTTSDVPCRPLQLRWLHDCFHTGRIQASYHAVGNVPVLTANVYGFCNGFTHENPRQQTDLLLETLTKEIVLGRSGVRVISGDFSHSPDALEQVRIWRRNGWQCAQSLAFDRWGRVPLPTCKNSTMRDFIFLSPEAAALCQWVDTKEVFAEHSTVIAGLALVGVDTISTWPQPAEIPWAQVDMQSWHDACVPAPASSTCPSTWFQQFSQHFERSLDTHCTGIPGGCLPARCHGRGQTLRPSKKHVVSPPKPSRSGEECASHSLLSLETKRWFQQLRRLQSLDHALKAGKMTAAALDYRLQLWASIKAAKGFHDGFPAWWTVRSVRLQGSPELLPVTIPSAVTAHHLFLDFRENYRKFEAWNVRQRSHILHEHYEHCREQLFKDLRDPRPEKVDVLVLKHHFEVLDVDESTSQIHIDSPADSRGFSSWSLDGQPVEVDLLSSQCCVIHGASSLSTSAELEQVQTLSSVADLVSEFGQLWSPRWQKHASCAPEDWQRVLGFAAAHLPTGAFQLPGLTIPMWRHALRRFKPWAARGPD